MSEVILTRASVVAGFMCGLRGGVGRLGLPGERVVAADIEEFERELRTMAWRDVAVCLC